MELTEVLRLAPEWLVMIVIIVAVVSWVGRIASEASASWAKVLGPLGRRWRERGIARQEVRAEERTARMADLTDMTRQRDALESALDHCRASQSEVWDYLVYDVDWHRQFRLAAAENGCEVPPHQSFMRWRQEGGA